jgi:tetratricopeptide (TPR) repeat protein
LFGEDHKATRWARHDLAHVLFDQGRWDEVMRFVDEDRESCRRALGPDHPDTLSANMDAAELLDMQGHFAESQRLMQTTLDRLRAVCGPDHTRTIVAENSLAALLVGRPEATPDDLARGLDLGKKIAASPVPGQAAIAWNTVGVAHYRREEWAAALAALQKADAASQGFNKCRNEFFLAMVHQRLGNPDAARGRYSSAAAWMEQSKSPNPALRRVRAEATAALRVKEPPK